MNCETQLNDIALYLYGELTPEDEERLEAHLDGCPTCAAELSRAREIAKALDRRLLEPSGALLAECRQELMVAVHSQASPGKLWQGLRGAFGGFFEPAAGLRRLAAAAALVAIGFVGARLSMNGQIFKPGGPKPADTPATAGFGPSGFVASGIRTVPGPSGEQQIVLEGTRTDQVTGSVSDERILSYLVAAATNPSNPGLRVESIDILKDHAKSAGVRQALVKALVRDPNPGVRLMALEGLKPMATETDVHRALARALLADENPGIRIEVIKIITERKDNDLVGVLQDLVQNEENGYVRMQCQSALREMKASEGHF